MKFKLNLDKTISSLFLYGMIFFPGFLMVVNHGIGSNYTGIILISFLIISLRLAFSQRGVIVSRTFILGSLLLFFFSLSHLILTSFIFYQSEYPGLIKSIFSLLSLIIVLLSCYLAFDSLTRINSESFAKTVDNIFKLLLFIGIISSILIVLKIQDSKKMLFFTEPSHYALIVSVFYCYKISIKKANILFFIPLILISLAVENLTLISGIVIAIIMNFMRLKTILLIPVIFGLLYSVMISTISEERLNYYTQRLNISDGSTNTSVLTLISGYEQGFIALRDSYGLGYGIQNMGYLNSRGEMVEIIGSLRDGNTDSNKYDGGLFISKLAVEFGFFGLCFFIYTIYLGFSNFRVKDVKSKFFSSVLLMSSMYFLLRGSGYFTPSAILIFISIIYISYSSHLIKKRYLCEY